MYERMNPIWESRLIHVSSAKDLDLSNGVIDKENHPVSDIRSCFGGENGKKSPQMELQHQNLFV